MNTSPAAPAPPPPASSSVPFLAPWIVIGGACITLGILWDISWHATIGRDTFWTPAHMVVYLGGTLGGLLAGWLALEATFLRKGRLTGSTVEIAGGRAPLGAWVCIWGAMAMLTSAPFDDWWHNAYGLDVKILSPPHALLALGMYGVVTGALMLVAARRNRAVAAGRPAEGTGWVVAANAVQLTLASVLLIEQSWPNLQHTSIFVMASCAMYPAFLVAAARHAPVPWAATRVALGYTLLLGFMVWVLPLFGAEPKLAPIFNRLTRMAPPAFPLLLAVPAVAIDLVFILLRRREGWGWNAVRVAACASLFLALFTTTQWHFSKFLISPAADNAFFAGYGRYFSYAANLEYRGIFWRLTERPITPGSLAWAWGIAACSAAVGLSAGGFLSRVKR
jgi:hypothetical protein